jgi:hypothetical protein
MGPRPQAERPQQGRRQARQAVLQHPDRAPWSRCAARRARSRSRSAASGCTASA